MRFLTPRCQAAKQSFPSRLGGLALTPKTAIIDRVQYSCGNVITPPKIDLSLVGKAIGIFKMGYDKLGKLIRLSINELSIDQSEEGSSADIEL